MTRIFPILAAAATVAVLAFSAGDASAMNLGARGGQPGGPSGPTGPTGSASNLGNQYIRGNCDDHVNLTELTGGARLDYLRRCEQQNRGI
jgi:hypothetical protein